MRRPGSLQVEFSISVRIMPIFELLLIAVNYKVGDYVNEGDVVVVLDSSELERKLKEALFEKIFLLWLAFYIRVYSPEVVSVFWLSP